MDHAAESRTQRFVWYSLFPVFAGRRCSFKELRAFRKKQAKLASESQSQSRRDALEGKVNIRGTVYYNV